MIQTEALSSELERFLLETRAGSDGGVQVRDAAPRLERIPDAVWFVAREDGRICGVYALVERPWGWWRCHLTVVANGDAVIEALVAAANAWVPAETQVAGGCEDGHVCLKRCLVAEGYIEVAQTEVIAWSRSRAHPDVGSATPDEFEPIRTGLRARGVAWPGELDPNDFLVLRGPDGPRAGVCVHTLSWHVDALGPGSRFTLPLLRALGLRLDPLALGSFLGSFGRPADVRILWSAALAHLGIPVALVGADVRDARWHAWKGLSRGAVGRLIGTSTQRIYARQPTPVPLDWTEDLLR